MAINELSEIPMPVQDEDITAESVRPWVQAMNRMRNVAGDNRYIKAYLAGGTLHIEWIGPTSRGLTQIWVKLTSSDLISGKHNQWTYTGTQQVRTATGWADATGSPSITPIYNSIEWNNTAQGIQGHGVNNTPVSAGGNYPNGFSVQPISRGTPIVQITVETISGQTIYTCQMSNADDGTCT